MTEKSSAVNSTDDAVVAGVREAIADVLKVPISDVGPDAGLVDDLGVMSIDFVDIMFRLEAKFNVTFHPDNPLDRLAAAAPSVVMVEDGMLTQRGAEILRRRMPEIDPSKINPGMAVLNVQALYTPSTWVRAVKELVDARPAACPSCGSTDLRPVQPSLLQCGTCEAQIKCPTQIEVLTAWAERELGND